MAKKSEAVKTVKIIKGVSGSPYFLAHNVGDTVELPTIQADELIEAQVAELVSEK